MSSYPRTNVICIVASQSHSDQQWRFVMNIKLSPSAAPLRHRGLFTLCASFILVALLVSACGGRHPNDSHEAVYDPKIHRHSAVHAGRPGRTAIRTAIWLSTDLRRPHHVLGYSAGTVHQ